MTEYAWRQPDRQIIPVRTPTACDLVVKVGEGWFSVDNDLQEADLIEAGWTPPGGQVLEAARNAGYQAGREDEAKIWEQGAVTELVGTDDRHVALSLAVDLHKDAPGGPAQRRKAVVTATLGFERYLTTGQFDLEA